ncbi:AMP-binding protein [Photorhabdus tasmaniensis]|uniref:AMP-binding protein n=1 Tax=Photorhabdus tasmaniensis TaxID=1004159 RepID=UPI004041BE69
MNIVCSGNRIFSHSDLDKMVNVFIEWFKSQVCESIEIVYGVFSKKIDYIVAYEGSKKLGAAFCPLPYIADLDVAISRENKIGVKGIVISDRFKSYIINGYCQKIPKFNDFSLCFLTSGSSGKRKLIGMSEKNIEAAITGIQARLNYRQSDIIASVLPQSFDYGFYQYLLAKKADCTLILLDNGYCLDSLKELCQLGATVLPGVPSMLANMATIAQRVMKDNSIRLITSTGETLSEGLIGKLEILFPKAEIAAMYGLTECKRVSIHPNTRAIGRGSVGKPIACCTVVIESQDESGVGEIVVKGTNVALGIFELGEHGLVLKSYGSKVLRTGDFGYLDNLGYLHVCGRKDDLVKIAGMRYSLKEIENFLYKTDKFEFVKVTIIEGCIIVICKTYSVSEKAILRLLVNEFGVHMSTLRVKKIGALELTENLKLGKVHVE